MINDEDAFKTDLIKLSSIINENDDDDDWDDNDSWVICKEDVVVDDDDVCWDCCFCNDVM
jgi:hypothetical protein